MHVLATILPLLALVSAAHNPPHLRHRKLAHSIQQRDAGAVEARADAGHAAAHRVIKRTIVKKGLTCRPRQSQAPAAVAPSPSSSSAAAPSSSAWSAEAAPSNAIDNQNAVAHNKATTTPAWTPSPTPSPSPKSTTPAAAASQAAAAPAPHSGLLSVNDGKCGWCNSDGNSPNGNQEWLNCGLKNGGWSPPHVTVDQLITAELNPHGVFAPCSQYFDLFRQYGGEFHIPPIMLASFAMQESTCNPGATGGGGEAGLMQIGPSNCEAGNNCWDIHYNVRRGAQLFRQMLDHNGGNVIAALGSYNGWRVGMSMDDATRAKYQGNCSWQNNLDYLTQWLNGWILDKSGYSIGTYFNLRDC